MRVKYIADSESLLLEKNKVYDVISIEKGWFRIMSELDEDYLFPPEAFIIIEEWAHPTLKEMPFWREGMTPEEYDTEREYYYKDYDLVRKGKYKPLWKQRIEKNT